MLKSISEFECDFDVVSIEAFKSILTSYEENKNATHMRVSYRDNEHPIIEMFEEVEDEKTVPVTYSTIKRIVGWSRFAECTNRNVYAIKEHGDYEDNEVFYITEEQAKELGL